ncbi:MAG: MFS transporter [Paracoccaceae bacterium]
MTPGIFFLALGYVLSQFYRSFLAVLAPVLGTEIGATATDLSFASGLWFLVFAAMQIPVGWALDHIGPRLTAALMLGFAGSGGAVVMATATTPFAIQAAMVLFGIAGAPILMASYYIFARLYPPTLFATLGGVIIGVGSIGNLAGAAPLAYAVGAFGWRGTMWALAGVALIVALALLVLLRDPPRAHAPEGEKGHLLGLLTKSGFLLLLPLMLFNYAPAAAIRGLWAGPYLGDVFGLGAIGIGRATLVMAIAMALGSFAYGPAERLLRSKKGVVLAGNLIGAGMCFLLWLAPDRSVLFATILFAGIGFFGASFPVLIAFGQRFMPAHLTGRGITLLNLFGVGGVGLMQFATGAFSKSVSETYATTPGFYGVLFLLFAITLFAGCIVFAFCRAES